MQLNAHYYVSPDYSWNSRSLASNVTASGKRGVMSALNGTGRLGATFAFSAGCPMTKAKGHSHHKPVLYPSVHVNRYDVPACVLRGLNITRPERHGEVNEERVVRDVLPNTDTSPKPIRHVALLFRFGRARGVQEPGRVEVFSICTVELRVAIEVPHVRHHDRALRDEHALVPVVLGREVWETNGVHGPPSQCLLDHGADVR
jgi:hypothetical protein